MNKHRGDCYEESNYDQLPDPLLFYPGYLRT